MAIFVEDGSVAPPSVVGNLVTSFGSFGSALAGTHVDPVNPSVNGALDREFGSFITAMSGTFTPLPSSGTTFLITPGMTMLDVRNLNLSFGDEVLFEAGGVWVINNNADRLICQSGVTYGRYGTGNNPLLDGTGGNVTPNFAGFIEAIDKNNVTIDGLDVTARNNIGNFLLWYKRVATGVIRNNKVFDNEGGGIILTDCQNILIQETEVTLCRGGPHESISITGGSTDIELDRVWSHFNGKACVNTKGACNRVEVHHCLLSGTVDDPMTYGDRSQNVRYHHNYITLAHTSGSTTLKPLASWGLEGLGAAANRWSENIEWDHNVVFDSRKVGLKVSIKWNAHWFVTRPPQNCMENIHVHHNTFVSTATDGSSFAAALSIVDNRDDARNTDPSSFPEARDWTGLIVENNIIFDANNSFSIQIDPIIEGVATIRANLYETGATFQGTNGGVGSVFTSDVMFTNQASGDFTLLPGSPAEGAGHDGTDIGSGLKLTDVLNGGTL